MNAQTPQKFTLEEIAERKKKLLNEIHAQKKAMTATTREHHLVEHHAVGSGLRADVA